MKRDVSHMLKGAIWFDNPNDRRAGLVDRLLCAVSGHPGWVDEQSTWQAWWPPAGPAGLHDHPDGGRFISYCIRCGRMSDSPQHSEIEAWRLAAIETVKRDKARGEAYFALPLSEQTPEGALAALTATKLPPRP